MLAFLSQLLIETTVVNNIYKVLARLSMRSVSTDPFKDPVYKKNVQRLIERNREFEKRP